MDCLLVRLLYDTPHSKHPAMHRRATRADQASTCDEVLKGKQCAVPSEFSNT